MTEQKQFTIKSPTPEDFAGVGEAQLQSWKETYPNKELGITKEWIQEQVGFLVEDRGNEFRKNSIKEALKPGSNTLYLVVKDETSKIQGFLHVSRKEPVAQFDAIYLTKKAQGTGIARDLMQKALEFIRDLPMEVRVASYNQRAIKFYEKYGFKITGELEELHKGKMPITVMIREVKK